MDRLRHVCNVYYPQLTELQMIQKFAEREVYSVPHLSNRGESVGIYMHDRSDGQRHYDVPLSLCFSVHSRGDVFCKGIAYACFLLGVYLHVRACRITLEHDYDDDAQSG